MPVERHIVRKRFGFLTSDSAVSFDFDNAAWLKEPYVAHSVLRVRTDGWLAKKAEEAGATVVTSAPVESLNWEGSRVHGVVQGGDAMTAPVTILADGANSRLALGTPIRPNARLSPEATELGIKEVYRLDRGRIEERFQLGPDEGHAEEWVAGQFPPGVMGGGFLYTNADTISVGLILNIRSLFGRGVYSQELIERFRLHPTIAERLQDAELVEYGAKLISSGWVSRPAAFHGDGWMVVGDAAGFVFSNGIVIQGMNYAIRTGLEAAETALASKNARNASAALLAQYDQRLESAGVLADFRDFEKMDRVKWNPRMYTAYPRFATELFPTLMTETGARKQPIRRLGASGPTGGRPPVDHAPPRRDRPREGPIATSAPFRLRRATVADVALLVRHRVGMWQAIGHHTPAQLRAHAPSYARWLRPRLRSGELEAWVAIQGAEAVASGALWWRPDQPRPGLPRAIPYILSMYTSPTARGMGIASAIVRKLLRSSRQRGADRVILHASTGGRSVYARLGFEPTNEMQLWLRRPA